MSLFDLCTQVGLQPVRVASTDGGEFHCACPQCGGIDRFRIHPYKKTKQGSGTFDCRQCNVGGNTISFAMKFNGYTYQDALEAFAQDYQPSNNSYVSFKADAVPREVNSPSDKWIKRATEVVEEFHKLILKEDALLNYLSKRGIGIEAVKSHKIGYNSSDTRFESRSLWGLQEENNERGYLKKMWIPKGIIIPYWKNGLVHKIKVRTDDTKNKYKHVTAGSNCMSLYGTNPIKDRMVVVESELDAIALNALVGNKMYVVASGSNLNRPDTITNEIALGCNLIAIAYDNDKAGKKMYYRWSEYYNSCIKYPVKAGKDVGEAIEQGWDVNSWVEKLLL